MAMRRWYVIVALVGALVFANGATLKGCKETPSASNSKKPGGPVVNPDHGPKKLIYVTWTIRGIDQSETYSATPGGQRDRVLLSATRGQPEAEVKARQDSAGFLSCIITYVNPRDGLLYVVDYEHDNANGGIVHCVVNRDKLNFSLSHFKGKKIPQPVPEGCSCDPDTIVLNVTWLKR
jgi:hypothetical protein